MGGRMAKASAAKKQRRLAREAVENEGIETLPWEKVSVRPVFIHKVKRRRDSDNYMASLKAAYDGLVDAGVVCDDDSEHMIRESPSFLIDKNSQCVILEVKRLE
jgi:crossover junction endodeoxyribonuclease RusA